tara:strand:+ start:481 stop:900 length:420 start_codon:yes stop_codon:yes gene_type:complete
MQYSESLHSLFISLQSLYKNHLELDNSSFQQIIAISIIETDGFVMSKFSKKLGIDNSTATRLIEGVEKKGWAHRIKSESDNRVVKVFLTESGMIVKNNIELQLEAIASIVEGELDLSSRGSVLESIHLLNWAVEKLKLK